MFALPFFRRDLPALKGERVTLRLPVSGDYREWADASARKPRLPRAVGAALGARRAGPHRVAPAARPLPRRFRAGHGDRRSSSSRTTSGKLLGGITLGNIRHGVAQTGHIGYWIGERYAGKGYMVEALAAGCRLRLRDAAGCTGSRLPVFPDNERSMRVLEKAGFQREGLLRSYLQINGVWQDHYLYALIADDPGGAKREGLMFDDVFLRQALARVCRRVIAMLCCGYRRASRSSRSRFRATTSRSISRGAVEIYRNQGENFQVSTAPGPDGIVRRIEVEANDERSSGDWAVFALANTTDEQLDRLIVAPHFRLVNSGLFWPDLGSSRIAAITPSEGFALDRQASPDADVFLVTLNPGAVVTFVAELASPNLPQVYLWEPGCLQGYGQFLHAVPRHRHRHRRPAGAVPDHPFRGQGNLDVPGDGRAVLGGACLYLRRFRLPQQGHRDLARQRADLARRHRGRRWRRPSCVFLFAYLNLNRWHGHFSYGALRLDRSALVLIAGVAVVRPGGRRRHRAPLLRRDGDRRHRC